MKRTVRTNEGRKRLGVLTFEWILLITVLVIGTIYAFGVVRNALIHGLTDLAESVEGMNAYDHEVGDENGFPPGHGNDHEDYPWWRPGPSPWTPPGDPD